MDAAPQALHGIEVVLAQPRQQLAIGTDLFLQGPERFQPGRQRGLLRRLGVDARLLAAPGLLQCRQRVLQVMESRVCLQRVLLRLGKPGLQRVERRLIGRFKRPVVGAHALTAAFKLARLFLHAALLCRQHLDLLLHQSDGGALRVGAGLRDPQRLLKFWQLLAMLLGLRLQDLALLLRP